MKSGLEFGKNAEICVGAGEFIGGEGESLGRGLDCSRFRFGGCAIAVGEGGDFYFDGDGFVLEISGGDGGVPRPMLM